MVDPIYISLSLLLDCKLPRAGSTKLFLCFYHMFRLIKEREGEGKDGGEEGRRKEGKKKGKKGWRKDYMTQDFCLVLSSPCLGVSMRVWMESSMSVSVADLLLCNDIITAPSLSWVSLSWVSFAQ